MDTHVHVSKNKKKSEPPFQNAASNTQIYI